MHLRELRCFRAPEPAQPLGIGPLEAMASGVPLVAPAAGGVLSYATRQNAWLAEPAGEDFADAVREAMAPARHATRGLRPPGKRPPRTPGTSSAGHIFSSTTRSVDSGPWSNLVPSIA